MPITVHVIDDAASDQSLDPVFEDLTLLDRTFSHSFLIAQVSRINRGQRRLEDAGRLVNQAIDLYRLYERATDGYFSAWINGPFDPYAEEDT